MEKKNENNKAAIRMLGKRIHPVFVANSENLQPYAELFVYEYENIAQKPLGTLFGIFKVNNTAVENAYVVNFLASTLRKEYFSNPRRSPSISLESALNRVNVALSELAKQGNTGWLGNMEFAVCALENETLHFSVSGESFIFLARNGSLTEISYGLSPEPEDQNPLKTFTDLSSGRLRHGDRVIITTKELINLFPHEKLQLESNRFSFEELGRLAHTALVNEFNLAATILVDFFEETRPSPTFQTKDKRDQTQPVLMGNYFSKNTFEGSSAISESHNSSQTNDTYPEPPSTKKMGHIYIQQEHDTQKENASFFQKHFPLWKEHCVEMVDSTKSVIVTVTRWIRKETSQFASSQFAKLRTGTKKVTAQMKKKRSSKTLEYTPNDDWQRFEEASQTPDKFHEEFQDQKEVTERTPSYSRNENTPNHVQYIISQLLNGLRHALDFIAKRLLPNIARLKQSFLSLSGRNKIIALVLLALIILAPLFLSRWSEDTPPEQKEAVTTSVIQSDVPPQNPFSQEKNISFRGIETLRVLTPPGTETERILALKNGVAALSMRSIRIIDDKGIRDIPFPEGKTLLAEKAVYMPDVDLVFLPESSEIVWAFSPYNNSFTQNKVALNTNPTSVFFATYLTYLYALDTSSGAIMRFPRSSQNGFAAGTVWLKTPADFAKVNDFAADGALFVAQKNSITRFFKNKQEPFTLEKTTTPLSVDKIVTQNESDPLIILDTKQNRIVWYEKSGTIQKQVVLEGDEKAKDIALSQNSLLVSFSSGKIALLE